MENRKYAPEINGWDINDTFHNFFSGMTHFEQRLYFAKINSLYRHPRYLYKYINLDCKNESSVNRLRDIVVRSDLWLSSRQDFNDPFDLNYSLNFDGTHEQKQKYLDKKFSRIEYSSKKRRELTNKALADKEFFTKIKTPFEAEVDNIGICCFTSNPRNILMWSHYAARHQGIVLQFYPIEDIKIFSIPRVEYADKYPIVNIVQDNREELKKIFLNKSKAWEYENEFRIVRIEGSRSYLPFNPMALKGIIFGCNASDNTRQCLISLLEERARFNHYNIRLYEAIKHVSEYKLFIKAL